MAQNQGLFSYPGVQAWLSFSITDLSGIAPAVGMLKMLPQYGIPDLNGDIVLTYDDQNLGLQNVIFKNCQIDAASYEINSGGQIVGVRILDERWSWAYRAVSGRYNYRLPNNYVDPDHEKTPAELATICFQALGVSSFDVSALPSDARPDVDWDYANAAKELATLCDDLGCRIVCQRSTGKWIVVVTGEGDELPEKYPIKETGSGIDPKEVPDFIRIITAPIAFQVALPLEAVAKNVDGSWDTLDDVKYAQDQDGSGGFGADFRGMSAVSYIRKQLPDGSKISEQELALQTVFRCWRVWEDEDGEVVIPGYDGDEFPTRKQLILTDELVQSWTDYRGAEHRRPAFVFGEFFNDITEGLGNVVPGTRIDYQGDKYRNDEEERASFSLTLDPVDTDLSILSTSKPMVYQNTFVGAGGPPPYVAATLFLTCAVHVRNADDWQPVRTTYLKSVGNGDNEDFCMDFVKNDIQPWFITTYNPDGTSNDTTDNYDEVQQQCKYYAESISKTLETIISQTRRYVGLFPIDMDGAISQVSYSIDSSGAFTTASLNSEHDFDIPDYQSRRQRDGRQNTEQAIKLQKEIAARRAKLLGTHNT